MASRLNKARLKSLQEELKEANKELQVRTTLAQCPRKGCYVRTLWGSNLFIYSTSSACVMVRACAHISWRVRVHVGCVSISTSPLARSALKRPKKS